MEELIEIIKNRIDVLNKERTDESIDRDILSGQIMEANYILALIKSLNK